MTTSVAPCPHCGGSHPAGYLHCPITGGGLDVSAPTSLIAGKYQLGPLLGEGGMGAVYQASHSVTGREVAVKRLHPEHSRTPRYVSRFEREAKLVARIRHPNIVEVTDFGTDESGTPFLVMEYLKGETLRAHLDRTGRLPVPEAAALIAQMLKAMIVLHRARIIHRDLKPQNLFLLGSGANRRLKVLDFGVSIAGDHSSSLKLTRTGTTVGTAYYLSPEQARGAAELDHRSDIFACGVVLYETVTGCRPFAQGNYHAVLSAILTNKPTPMRELAPALPHELCFVVQKAMATDVSERYLDAKAMLDDLIPFLKREESNEESRQGESGTRAALPRVAPVPLSAAQSSEILVSRAHSRAYARKHVAEPFLACSDDWAEGRHPALDGGSRAAKTGDTHLTQVRGSLLVAAREYVEKTYGREALLQVVADAPEASGIVLAVGWVPIETFTDFLRRAEARGPDLADAVGSYCANRPSVRRLLERGGSPAANFAALERIWPEYHNQGEVQVERMYSEEPNGEGFGDGVRLTIKGLMKEPRQHTLCFVGFFRRMAELGGATSVVATLDAQRSDGAPENQVTIRWART